MRDADVARVDWSLQVERIPTGVLVAGIAELRRHARLRLA